VSAPGRRSTRRTVAWFVSRFPGYYRVRVVRGWPGAWVWQWRRCNDSSRMAWHAVCRVEDAEAYFTIPAEVEGGGL